MPELPEVETVVNAIKKSLKSMTINRFIIMNNKLRWKIDSDISNSVKDQEINLIYRNKYPQPAVHNIPTAIASKFGAGYNFQ